MKNPLTVVTILAASTQGVSSFAPELKGFSATQRRGQALAAKKGVARVPSINKSSVSKSSVSRFGQKTTSMRDSILNTHRFYPLGRDSREALASYGINAFLESMTHSATSTSANMDVNQGTIDEHTHSLGDLTQHNLHAFTPGNSHVHSTSGLPVPTRGVFSETIQHLEHDLVCGTSYAKTSLSALDIHQHHNAGHTIPVELLRDISVRTGNTAEGKSTTPALLISGGLTLAALGGVAHGVQALDQVLMFKLQSFPELYQYAARMNEGLGSFITHMEASGVGHCVRHGLTEMIKYSNIETAVDSQDPRTLRQVKLNLKPVAGGPTFSMTLLAAPDEDDEGVGDDKKMKVERSNPKSGLKTQGKALSVDLPNGSLTLTLPEPDNNPRYKGLRGPESIPASLSFVEKHSGAEFILAKIDIPLLKPD